MFGISRQGYYKALKRTVTERITQEEEVVAMAKQVRKKLQRAGTRKIYTLIKANLEAQCIKVGRDKLFRLLSEAGMLVKRRKKYVITTNSNHPFRKYRNLIREKEITGPEEVWVSDLTYIPIEKGFCYLSMITDAYSRMIMGYDLSDNIATDGAIRALRMALRKRVYNTELIHHSDRGAQYCSYQYTNMLRQNNIRISMTENSDPYENALAERMNRTIKEEFIVVDKLPDIAVARKLIDESVELYNQYRPHLSCNMKTPIDKHNFFIVTLKNLNNYININQ